MLELLATGHGVEQWLPLGDVSWVRLDGSMVMAAVDRDEAEIRRRRRLGLGAVLNRQVLRVVGSLPPGVAVPLDLIETKDRRVLQALPKGIVDWYGTDVTVMLRPALSLLSVGVVASTWQRGLRQSGPFASYCPRYVVLAGSRGAMDTSWVQAQARFYGIGLAVHQYGGLNWQVAPADFDADRFTTSSWLMAERVAEALGL